MTSEVARDMDPHHRLMLEVVYEALESAGIPLESAAGTNTAVFGGIMYKDYHDSLNRDPKSLPRYFITGNAGAMVANRISHFFDLRGPSVTIDTACSTTLTALHLACQSLRAGESDMAVVVGANLMLNSDVFVTMSNLGFLSPDGISYAFDSRANGYGRGEGVAAIVLKALPKALADHDPVRTIIRETALNQDGKTPAITAPSDMAQEQLIRECYNRAGIDTSQTSYIEAHGTGTPTGDPLEISAISRAFQGQPLYAGSVKANIGHTEAASGLSGIIKVALSLEKGMMPPSPRFLRPNKKLMLKEKNIKARLLSSAQPWPLKDGIRRASVNNFGFGGSNAHVILEWHNPDSQDQEQTNGSATVDAASGPARIYILSAKDEPACKRMISNLRNYIENADSTQERNLLASLAYTLGSRRSALPWKTVFAADSLNGILHSLDGGQNQPERSRKDIRVGWVFSGQGAQWHAMGRELFEAYPVFKTAIRECDSYIKEMGATWTITDELHRDEETTRVNDAEFSLPLSTAIQIAVVRLFWSWGIRPTGITSHSSGEAAAAFAAGVLSARSAIGITYIRGALTRKGKSTSGPKGGMMAVGLGRSEADDYISRVIGDNKAKHLVVGCVNSPSSVTVSGDLPALAELEQLLHADKVFARKLKVTEAFHSSHMKPMAAEFATLLVGLLETNDVDLATTPSSMVYSSPKTGRRMSSFEPLLVPSHWTESMLQAVEFESSFIEMCWDPKTKEQCVDVVVEIGPHGALGGPITQIMQKPELGGASVSYLSSLSRGKCAVGTTQGVATALMRQGYRLEMDAINFPHGRDDANVKVLHDLPTYSWSHQLRYWREPRNSRALRQNEHPPHHLIGSRDPLSPFSAPTWTNTLRMSDIPWVRDHVVGSDIVFPGAGFISMAIDAMSQAHQPNPDEKTFFNLRDVDLMQALVLPVDAELDVDLRLAIRPCDEKSLGVKGWYAFSVHSISGEKNTWTEHCTGLIRIEKHDRTSWDAPGLPALKMMDAAVYSRKTDPKILWESLHETGICHGPIFQNISQIRSSGRLSLCTFQVADTASIMPCSYESQHLVHPTTLDSAIQAAYSPLVSTGKRLKAALVPRRLKKLKVASTLFNFGAGSVLGAQVCLKKQSSQSFSADLAVFDGVTGDEYPSTPDVLIEIEGLSFQSLGVSLSDKSMGSDGGGDTRSSWSWAPDITLMDSGRLSSQLSAEAELREKDLMMDLRRCTIHFITEAMEHLMTDDIERLDGHWKKFHHWMTAQLALARDDRLGPGSSSWLLDDAEHKASVRARVVEGGVNGEMITHLGPQLLPMLRGQVEPLELMMEGRLLSRYYVEALKWKRSNTQASELIKLLAHKNPRCRILEVGGGTGGCTELILSALGDSKPVDRYDFTDVSAGFFEPARERFADWQDVMTYSTLDIEKDPASQGFECASYDIVVACQVLHATTNMKRTLSNVRKLLKPGGKLVLVETTNDQLDLFFTFGLLPGWWLSEEEERQLTPSLTPDLWRTMLSASGFNGVELEVRDCNDTDFYMISTIMSSATVEPVTADTESSSDAVLVYGDRPPPSEWLNDLQSSVAGATTTGSAPSITSLDEADVAGKTVIFLGEVQQNLLSSMETDAFARVKSMLVDSRAVIWVARGATMACDDPRKALHVGLLRTLRNETNGKPCISLDIDPSRNPWTPETIDAILQVFHTSLGAANQHSDFEYAERDGIVHVPRAVNSPGWRAFDTAEAVLKPFKSSPGSRLRMHVERPGLLDSLCFREEEIPDLPADWVEIEPVTFGLNFTDIMVAMGQIKQDPEPFMGFECAGVIMMLGETAAERGLKVGDRVCALQRGHWATRVQTPSTNVVLIPSGMSFEDAASIPQAFATAYISLFTTANLRKGERVLIHSGAGGVGQAAIMLSQLAGAEVFVTAGTQAKRDFVCRKFGISPDHVYSSRDASFVDGIRERTGREGVDVALNSLAGHLLQATFDCMAEFGRFVEIGQKDLEQDSRLSMHTFMRNVSFQCVDLLAWERAKGGAVQEALKHIMKLLEDKQLGLIDPVSAYPISDIEKVFRTMQGGQHVGKLVVTASEKDLIPVRRGASPLRLRPDASYLVVGGLGGIGRRICEWLVDHGARNLIILSRSSAERSPFVASLEQRGCVVLHHACDVADEVQLAAMLRRREQEKMPPIRGVLQCAMVLRDALFTQMTADDFNAALRPKVQGSWNLHETVAQDVDFFVMLSSLVGVMGGAGQANYAAASAFQDALAQHRRAQGKPATTIDLGMVKSMGYVAEAGQSISERLVRIGYKALHEEDVLLLLEKAIVSPSPPSSSSDPSQGVVVTGINTSRGSHWSESRWIQEARFAGLKYREAPVQGSRVAGSSSQQGHDDIRGELGRAASYDEAMGVVLREMSRKLMRMFGLAEDDMSASKSLTSIGVDSLVAIELRTWITSQLNVDVPIFELMEGNTVTGLAEVVVRKLGHAKADRS
ncbi:polyketide synthase [Colletotrichum tabaci]|uniref:Polyketide synthase n=1 Tax=Colletotrichum tabaci TaxID=1209068 RepID=A0AAV9TQ89_9PEZI